MPWTTFKRSSSTPNIIMGPTKNSENVTVSNGATSPVSRSKLMPLSGDKNQRRTRRKESTSDSRTISPDREITSPIHGNKHTTERGNVSRPSSRLNSRTPSAKKRVISETPAFSSPIPTDYETASTLSTGSANPEDKALNENKEKEKSEKQQRKAKKEYQFTYRDILRHLLKTWEDQLCESNRPFVEYSAERDYLYRPDLHMPRPKTPHTPHLAKAKAAETVVEVVRHLQRGHSAPVSRQSSRHLNL